MTHPHSKVLTEAETVEHYIPEGDETPPQPATKIPSWFAQSSQRPDIDVVEEIQRRESGRATPYLDTPGEDAYESYRRRMEQRFKDGQKLYDMPQPVHIERPVAGPTPRRPTLPVSEVQSRKRQYETNQPPAAPVRARPARQGMSISNMAALGALAACIGIVGGLGVSNYDVMKQKFINTLSSTHFNLAQATPALKPALGTETVITKKSVAIATLDVNDVRGRLNSMIPLALVAQSADADNPVSLKLSGLPPSAYLTAGVQTEQGKWLLKPSELKNVKLVVPQSDARQFDLEVAAVEDKTGALAAPIKALNVELDGAALADAVPVPGVQPAAALADVAIVKPVSATPDNVVEKPNLPSAIPAANGEGADLVNKGNALLQSGDIITARQFYLRASELGDGQGAFGVARSYDPKVFAQLNVVGLKPDPEKAAEWYKKAAESGVVASQQ